MVKDAHQTHGVVKTTSQDEIRTPFGISQKAPTPQAILKIILNLTSKKNDEEFD
jgi:hypothetical protein